MMNLEKPILENKVYGPGGGIPLLKSLWEKFDLSLLFLQTGFQKHSGISAWLMALPTFAVLLLRKLQLTFLCWLFDYSDKTQLWQDLQAWQGCSFSYPRHLHPPSL